MVGLVSIVTNARIAAALTSSISIINSPPLLLPLMITTFKLSWDAKKLWYFGIPACTVVGILAEGWMRRGSPFLTGYEGNRGFQTLLPYSGLPGFSYPLILGILSILFSFGKGLLFFTPGLVLVGNEAERISPGAKLRQLQQLLLLLPLSSRYGKLPQLKFAQHPPGVVSS